MGFKGVLTRSAGFLRRRPDLAEIAAAFAASRLVVALAAHLSHMVVAKGRWYSAPRDSWLDLLFRWDSAWYLSIVEHGYSYTPGRESNVAFFPLYPMLVKAVSYVTGNAVVAGFLVSNISLLAAAFIINELLRLDYPTGRTARRAVTYLLIAPASLFFSIFYTEGLFLFLTAAAVYAARRGWWFAAGVAGACVALTRTAGILVAPAIAVEYLHSNWQSVRNGRADRRELARVMGSLALIPGATAAHVAHLYARFGDGLVFSKASAVWGRKLVTLAHTWKHILREDPFYSFVFGAAFLLAPCALAVLICRKARPSLIVFAGTMMLLDMSSNLGESMPRYLGVLFPLYLAPALLAEKWNWLESFIVFLSVFMLVLFTVLFANGYWLT